MCLTGVAGQKERAPIAPIHSRLYNRLTGSIVQPRVSDDLLTLKTVVGSGLLMSAVLAPTIQSRRGHQLCRVKRSALRLRLTGSVVQPTSRRELLIG